MSVFEKICAHLCFPSINMLFEHKVRIACINPTYACVESCVGRAKNTRAARKCAYFARICAHLCSLSVNMLFEHKVRIACINPTHACVESCIDMFKCANLCARLITYEPAHNGLINDRIKCMTGIRVNLRSFAVKTRI